MKRKQSTVILSAAMAAMMLMSGCGKDGGSAQQETATKNADGKYEPTLTITIAKQLDENTGRYGDGWCDCVKTTFNVLKIVPEHLAY